MTTAGVPGVGTAIRQVSVGSLRAEYSVGRSNQTGEWVAVGTVRSMTSRAFEPAWILVGIGRSERDAVEDLRRQLEREERRVLTRRIDRGVGPIGGSNAYQAHS